MKKFLATIFFLIILLLAGVGGFWLYVSNQLKGISKNPDSEAVRIEIPSGMSVKGCAEKLKENNLIKNEKLFCIFASRPNLIKYFSNVKPEYELYGFVLKSGIYYVKPNMSVQEIYNLLSSGRQEYITVSIPEGYTISQIGKLLEEKKVCNGDEFKKICKNRDFLSSEHIPFDSAEGYLFPDTYFFIPDSDPSEIASKLIRTFFEKISTLVDVNTVTQEELNNKVILASIVEREYRVPEEAPLIASVFQNRLKINMGLGSCATIVYILTEIEGRPHPSHILWEDTKIDSPYNTYKWAGLTPGPISNPGMTALSAVFNAPKTNYYFFQVKDSSKGTHVFSSTFDEHVENHNLSVK